MSNSDFNILGFGVHREDHAPVSTVVEPPMGSVGTTQVIAGESAVSAGLVSAQKVKNFSAAINERLSESGRRVEVRLDEATGKLVLTVYDSKHETLVFQLPPESSLRLSESIDKLKGLVLNKVG